MTSQSKKKSTVKAQIRRLKQQKDIEQLILLLRDGDSEIQDEAVSALKKLRDNRTVDPLIQILRNSRLDIWARCAAVDVLGAIGDPRALEPVIKASKSRDPRLQYVATVSLGQIGGQRAVERLIKALSHRNRDVRAHAAQALGDMREAGAVEALIRILQGPEHRFKRETGVIFWSPIESVRAVVAEALGKIADARAIEPLTKARWDQDQEVRKAAKEALEKIRPWKTEAAQARVAEPDVDTTKTWLVRDKVNGSLGELISKADVDDWSKRHEIAQLLSKGYKSEIPVLVSALQGTSWYVRDCVASALRQLGWKPSNDKETILYLIGTLRSNRSCDELVRMGDKVVEHLQPLLKDKSDWAAERSAKIIDSIKYRERNPAEELVPRAKSQDQPKEPAKGTLAKIKEMLGWNR